MKSITIVFLISLFAFSVIENSKLLSVSKKTSVELCDNTDEFDEVIKKDQSKKYAAATTSLMNHFYNEFIPPSTSLTDKLFYASLEVEIRPPRIS